jgi:hypothetical protein
MRIRFLPVVIAALALPVAALGDLGPHSNYYDQHPPENGQKNDVSVVVDRKTDDARVYVYNFCLGSTTYPGSSRTYPKEAAIMTHVSRGMISFDGKAKESSSSGTTTIKAKLSATVTPSKVTGDAHFRGTNCGKISFVAKLQQKTP